MWCGLGLVFLVIGGLSVFGVFGDLGFFGSGGVCAMGVCAIGVCEGGVCAMEGGGWWGGGLGVCGGCVGGGGGGGVLVLFGVVSLCGDGWFRSLSDLFSMTWGVVEV